MTSDDLLNDTLVQLSFAVMADLSQVAAAHGLSLTHLRLLGILRDREPTMSALAGHLGLDRSSVSGLVDRAVAKGYVERVASEVDARSSRVVITPAGNDFARSVAAEVERRTQQLLAPLSGRERRQLERLLRRLLP